MKQAVAIQVSESFERLHHIGTAVPSRNPADLELSDDITIARRDFAAILRVGLGGMAKKNFSATHQRVLSTLGRSPNLRLQSLHCFGTRDAHWPTAVVPAVPVERASGTTFQAQSYASTRRPRACHEPSNGCRIR